MQWSDYVVYVDESGDHGLASIDPSYPIFVLAFCIFNKQEYCRSISPALRELKYRYWGHDEIVIHEHEIRKPAGSFTILVRREIREAFFAELNGFMEAAEFVLLASVIRKERLTSQYVMPDNPYEIAMGFGLERLYRLLDAKGQTGRRTHIVVERRGKREDQALELVFRRICDGKNYLGQPFPFELVMIDKKANSTGLQLADLVARPIGIKTLRPNQPNRAYDILTTKFRRSPKGVVKGWGLKVFP